ncbi:MAG: hypothetical protein U5K56_11755 [Halioglobus sp.]|nr:hypothetical protein [Halioglobus sp.]
MKEANYLKQVLSLLEGDKRGTDKEILSVKDFPRFGYRCCEWQVLGFGSESFQMFALVGFLAGIAPTTALERTKDVEILLCRTSDQEWGKSRLEVDAAVTESSHSDVRTRCAVSPPVLEALESQRVPLARHWSEF